ncbi:hypothetical protein HRW18_05575 [Streptomyces lunaelactis]|uniref:hypothetical protein n=1 Tax=Streptomyces lunaelactis TaxID=1535768 RepID=UPI001585660F|nr:hypothetical protein [Streptomyces lunaelactis]NUK07492.1 hypothetical protein [Streptomyces lunaelactis]
MPQQTDHDVDTSDDPNEPYPAAIGVYCDGCGTDVVNDYIVSDALDREARFEIARAHLRREGWSCTEAGDFCPACKPAEGSAP